MIKQHPQGVTDSKFLKMKSLLCGVYSVKIKNIYIGSPVSNYDLQIKCGCLADQYNPRLVRAQSDFNHHLLRRHG